MYENRIKSTLLIRTKHEGLDHPKVMIRQIPKINANLTKENCFSANTYSGLSEISRHL